MSAGFSDNTSRSRKANAFLGKTSRNVSGKARMTWSFSNRANTDFRKASCLPTRNTSAGSPTALHSPDDALAGSQILIVIIGGSSPASPIRLGSKNSIAWSTFDSIEQCHYSIRVGSLGARRG